MGALARSVTWRRGPYLISLPPAILTAFAAELDVMRMLLRGSTRTTRFFAATLRVRTLG